MLTSADIGSGPVLLKRSLGYAHHFRPTYAPRQAGAGEANVGHPSDFPSRVLSPKRPRESVLIAGSRWVISLWRFREWAGV
jgi:hypothetical protein